MHDGKRVGFLLAIVALIGAMLACGGEVSPTKVGEVLAPTHASRERKTERLSQQTSETEAPASTSTPQGPETYKVGDVISIGNMVMVVLGWETVDGDEFNKPDEGKRFIAVDVLFVNQGTKADSISTMLQMGLKDDTGQKYSVDLMAQVAASSSSVDGEISPGERLRGKVGFQVPQDASGLVFVFDADVFGTGKVFVELGPKPVSLQPPKGVLGEEKQTTFAIGDVIEVGDLVVIVNNVAFPPGDEFNKPDKDNKFVVVDLTLKNNGSKSVAISSLLQMSLKDTTGQKYGVDLMATVASGGSTPDGEIAPGEKVRGQVGFQVPESAEGLVFVFDADVFGYGKVFVALR
ncbi:MAG: DUF4352 domain-containing protein [Chloroflexi bacterium]|nr:DUF4352 domain-containing protein [Chloroflexota bacterium]